MCRATRALVGLLLSLVCLESGSPQDAPATSAASPESSSPDAGPAGPQVVPEAVGGCEEMPDPTGNPCTRWVCVGSVWREQPKPAGTVCDDGQLCTHTDRCDAAGGCRGVDISWLCSSQCLQCNGSPSCSTAKAPVGTTCSKVPGFEAGCGCTAAGVCAVKAFSSAAAITGICWDARGNMRGKYVAPVGAACKAACPSP